MVATQKTVKVTPERSVEELLADAETEPVLLERNGTLYRLSREGIKPDIWEGYEPDPEAIGRMLDEVAGSWSDLDTDKMIAELYEARAAGSRSAQGSR